MRKDIFLGNESEHVMYLNLNLSSYQHVLSIESEQVLYLNLLRSVSFTCTNSLNHNKTNAPKGVFFVFFYTKHILLVESKYLF